MKAGEVLNVENLRCVRPANGLAPRYYEELLGKRVKEDVLAGTPIKLNLIID
jgi:N-acetylneuraminate synthase